ncbi:DNA repair protein RecN [Pleionea sediminis]|uniref:DNA repair protein RecN n=1 Tax=Pleionea sediminis TaxID=2569479 RepID=UPI0011850704|nr:DNA repair protein RecN [Pleionea sediminis]
MLASIQIKNFALIEQLELDFQTGLTVITGETGAGKSIVIDALGLALGERAESSMIRFGQEKADISACFHVLPNSLTAKWLEENELDEGADCILRRVIAKEGRSKCFINGRSATLSMLKALGDTLVDIHGQHAHQSLLKPHQQLALLDELIDDESVLSQIKQIATDYKRAARQLATLKKDTAQREERAELLSYQLQELEAFNLSKEAIEELEQEHARASNIQELTQTTQMALNDLFDQEPNVYGQLQHLQQQFNDLAAKDPALQSISDLMATTTSSLEEVKAELRHYEGSLEVDPEQFNELNDRLTALFDLARKHKVEMHELPEVQQAIKTELEALQSDSAETTELEKTLRQLAEDYQNKAQKLTKLRAKTAKQLNKDVTKHMQTLGMEGGQFEACFQENKESFSKFGAELVEFQVTANPGQPLQSLAKVASGGELSRISLAIQMITAKKRVTPCLIFDEVDVGIGGQTADIVGRMLKNIAEHAQVLCVTHQPQVAAKGHQHLQANKTRLKDATETEMNCLTEDMRVEEIARMVGGQSITESTLSHAKELLAS